MESQLIRRPLISLLAGRSQCLFALNSAARRQESSYRRSKQRLNVKPDASFLLSRDSLAQDHIIFNPPSSAPSVFHTPIKFLPKDDKRRQLLMKTASKHTPQHAAELPPLVKAQSIPKSHLSQEDIALMQKLRLQDPDVWTEMKLARKFKCTHFFVQVCIRAVRDRLPITEKMKANLMQREEIMDRWGPRRRKAREDKAKRVELALRGD